MPVGMERIWSSRRARSKRPRRCTPRASPRRTRYYASDLAPHGNERPQFLVAQENAQPDQDADDDRKYLFEQGRAGAHLDSGCAAEVACEQDRAEHGGARNDVEDDAEQFEDADP